MPASSEFSECTFSVAGLMVSNLRTTLDPDSVEQIIFVIKNLKSETIAALAAACEYLGENPESEMDIKSENYCG